MCLNLLQPVLDVIKGTLFSAIVNKNDAHGALIVCLSDSTEAFLTRSIPNLKFHSLILHIDSFDLKVNTDGWHMACREVIFRKSKQDATLSDRRVANYDEFNKVVVLFLTCLHFFL